MSRINGARRATPDSRSDAGAPLITGPQFDARTRLLLEGPIVATLLRLATPNVLVMFVQASVGLIETYFVAKLGTDALAGVALVFPVLMLMQMMSAGAMGGGISSAIARALGAGRRADAEALVLHALAISVAFGVVFMLAVLGGGRWLYGAMGGSGASLAAALIYSQVVFSGAVLIWVFNSLANVIRGTGNMAIPAIVTCAGAAALIPVSPALIFGWGPLPRLGVAGGAVAVLAYYAVGSIALAAYLWSGRSVVRLAWAGIGFRWPLFRDILRVGAVAALITVQTNLTIAIATGLVGRFGPAAIAGYGTGSRLEYLLVPLVFGLGGPLVAMVGTNLGAGQRDRALRAAWIGAAIAAGLTELIGLWAAAVPHAWLALFDTDPAMLDAGSRYLHTVGPLYGLFGLGMALYFALQGAGRLLWPLLANLMRLAIAAGGGWLALRWSGDLSSVFLALGAALAAFGLINAGAVARGAWFDSIGRPRPRLARVRRRSWHDAAISRRRSREADLPIRAVAHRHRADHERRRRFRSAALPSRRGGGARHALPRTGGQRLDPAAVTMRLLVESDLTTASGLVGTGFDECRWPRPVRPGHKLRVESEVLEVRPSRSRPDQGLIKVRTTTLNQDGEAVQIAVGPLVVPRLSRPVRETDDVKEESRARRHRRGPGGCSGEDGH